MGRYVLRRLLQLIPVFFGTTFLIYWLVWSVPGDPFAGKCGERACPDAYIAKMTEKYNLDQNIFIQYFTYMKNLFQGDFGEFLASINTVDLLLFLAFAGFFVLGFAQGTIRRLIGLASVTFSFFLAANLSGPLGAFLGENWLQFTPEYAYTVGFLTIFVAAALAFALVAQGWYKPQPLFEKARFVDEVLGGLLGIVQAGVILGAIIVILGTFFLVPGIAEDADELPFLRETWDALATSAIGQVFIDTLIPAFFAVFGFLIPDSIEAFFPGTGS